MIKEHTVQKDCGMNVAKEYQSGCRWDAVAQNLTWGSGPTAEPIVEIDDFGAPSPEDRRMETLLMMWSCSQDCWHSFPEMKCLNSYLKMTFRAWKDLKPAGVILHIS